MLMSGPRCAIFLSRQNTQGHTLHSEWRDWLKAAFDWCLSASCPGSAQAFIFAPLTLGTGSTVNAAQSFTSPGWTLNSPWPSLSSTTAQLCSGLSRVAELHTGMQKGHEENTGSLQRQESALASPQVCITHQWVLRTSLPQGHTATLWKPLFLSQAAEQGCREKAPQPHWCSAATLLTQQQATHTLVLCWSRALWI